MTNEVHELRRFGTLVPIGAGSHARVYAGIDPVRGIEVAIKRLRTPDLAAAERMRRECRILQSLQHPNLCPLLEWGERGDEVWMVMPRLAGADLQQCLRDLSLEQRLLVLNQTAAGLQEAHAAGLIHRDLKPANIWVDQTDVPSMRALVLDFGIARAAGDATLTAAGDVLGTPTYMAPEQARGDVAAVDARCDIWALGVVLFEMLCDRPPFVGNSAADVLAQVLNDDAPSPLRLKPRTPEALARICIKCLERDPHRRYANAEEFLRDLRRYQDGHSVRAPSIGLWHRLRRTRARHPWFMRVTVLLTLGLLASLVLSAWTHWQSRILGERSAELAGTAERVRARMQIAYLSPLHDVLNDQRAVRKDVDALQFPVTGRLEAVRLRALAEALLALGEPAHASDTLHPLIERPQAQTEDLLLYADLQMQRYIDSLRRSDGLESEQATALRDASRQHLLQPALRALSRLPNHSTIPALTAARRALTEGDTERALQHNAEHVTDDAADYRAPMQRGDIALWQARQARVRGDLESSNRMLNQAGAAFDSAAAIGRSDPRILHQRCLTAIDQIRLDTVRGLPPPTNLQAMNGACMALNLATPNEPDALLLQAQAWSAIAAGFSARNELTQARESLRLALEQANLTLDRTANFLPALLLRAEILRRQAGFDYDDFKKAQTHFDAALLDLEHYRQGQPEDWPALVSEGHTLAERGRHKANFRADPLPDYERAIGLLERAAQQRRDAIEVRQRLSQVRIFAFYALRDQAPERAETMAEAAIDALDEALDNHPEHVGMLFDQGANLGDLWLFQAVRQQGDLPLATMQLLDRAFDLLDRARALAPQRADVYSQTLALATSASERLRSLSENRDRYIQIAEKVIAASSRNGISPDPAFAAWSQIEHAEALSERNDEATDRAFAQARDGLDRGADSPDHRFAIYRYQLQWSAAYAHWLRKNHRVADAVIRYGNAQLAEAQATERGMDDNIVLCEGGRYLYERSHFEGHQTAAKTARRSLELLEQCRAQGELYFNAYYQRLLSEVIARVAAAEQPARSPSAASAH